MSSEANPSAEPTPGGLRALWPYALLLAVGLFVLLPKLGDFGFWDPWEPKYAESAREMVEHDSLIVPYYRESVRLTKPILVYWGVLAGSALFGLNEFGARIVGVCFALTTLAGVFYSVSRLRGRQAGLISALVLATVPQFYFIARQAMPDVYLLATQGICLLFFCLGLFGPEKRRNLHFVISYAALALAVLAKGPVIIGTVFLTTLAIFAVIRIDLREFWQRGRRTETVLLCGTAIPTTVILGLLAFAAYLFGTSAAWWGYSGRSREEMALVRGQIEDSFTRTHLAEIILGLIVAAGAVLAFQLFRRGRGGGKAMAVFPGLVAAAAAAGLVTAGPEDKIFLSSVLGSAGCLYVVTAAIRRFLHQAWLWPQVQPWLKPVGRQLLLFLAVFTVVAGPWHIGIFLKLDHGYITDFIIKHNIHRAGDVVSRTGGTSDFYLRVLIFGLFPWSCFLPAAIASLVGWRRNNPLQRYALEVYLLIATLVTFAAFTTAATKFAHYLSPIVVPACVLIGLVIARSLEERHSTASRLTWIVASMLFLLPVIDLLSEDGFMHLVGSFTMKAWVPPAFVPGAYYHALLIVVGAALFASIVVRSRVLLAGMVAAAALMANYSTATFIPNLSIHKTMKHLCETWKKEAPGGDPPICFFGDTKHSFFFYTEYRIRKMRDRPAFQEFMDPAREAFCIVERDSLKTLRLNHRTRYEGAQLYLANDTHFNFVLIRNFDPNPSAGATD